jgi:hypothetical protein
LIGLIISYIDFRTSVILQMQEEEGPNAKHVPE